MKTLRLKNIVNLAWLACALIVLSAHPAVGRENDDDDHRERVEREARDSGRERYDPALPVPILEASSGVRAGQRVVVRWSRDDSIEECELLLSIDGGRTFHLRISPELEGPAHRYVWRVPNLSAHHARIRLRARVEDLEVEGPMGEAFEMVADPERPPESWLFREGGWSEEVEGLPAHGTLAETGRRAEIHSPRNVPEARPEDRPDLEAPARSSHPLATDTDFHPRAVEQSPTFLSSRFRPLRE